MRTPDDDTHRPLWWAVIRLPNLVTFLGRYVHMRLEMQTVTNIHTYIYICICLGANADVI